MYDVVGTVPEAGSIPSIFVNDMNVSLKSGPSYISLAFSAKIMCVSHRHGYICVCATQYCHVLKSLPTYCQTYL